MIKVNRVGNFYLKTPLPFQLRFIYYSKKENKISSESYSEQILKLSGKNLSRVCSASPLMRDD